MSSVGKYRNFSWTITRGSRMSKYNFLAEYFPISEAEGERRDAPASRSNSLSWIINNLSFDTQFGAKMFGFFLRRVVASALCRGRFYWDILGEKGHRMVADRAVAAGSWVVLTGIFISPRDSREKPNGNGFCLTEWRRDGRRCFVLCVSSSRQNNIEHFFHI